MADGPERSTLEIKSLLLKLSPNTGGNHKDRVRALTKFRNYASGANTKNKGNTPEFYDDDLPLLFLGSESSTALYDDEQYGDLSSYYGLLQACATPSSDHQGGLKRSARNAMHLVKYLACDHVDMEDGEPVSSGVDATSGLVELNPFAYALCILKPSQLKIANFDAHIKDTRYNSSDGNARTGAKSEACKVLVLLFTRHFDPDARNSNQPTLYMEDLLPSAAARQSFENWMVQNCTKDVQNKIRQRADKSILITNPLSPSGNNASNPFASEKIEVDIDAMDAFKNQSLTDDQKEAMAEAEAHADEQLEDLGIKLFDKDDPLLMNMSNELPTRWSDSKLAKHVQLNTTESGMLRNSVVDDDEIDRKSKNVEKIKKQDEERKRLVGLDPLGIRPPTFDLNNFKGRASEMLHEAIEDLEEEMEDLDPHEKELELIRKRKKKKDRHSLGVDMLITIGAQKSSLEEVLTGGKKKKLSSEKEDDEKIESAEDLSILPSDPNFDPMLFLTLLHRGTGYEQLKAGIERLGNQSDDHMQRIQERVKENFGLYIRCADGIDLFSDKAGKTKSSQGGPNVHRRIDKLEELAELCSGEAKKSFKPLLDNTSEVRKVQSALAVLSRVGPLLQVPSLMRQHIENGRFSAAIKAYRRVLVIDDDNKIKLLSNIKVRAADAARMARDDLECRLANPSLPLQSLLDSIRDLRELNELEIPDSNEEESKSEEKELIELPRVEFRGLGEIAVGETIVNVRELPPGLACLQLQAAHFSQLVNETVKETETAISRLHKGETLAAVHEDNSHTIDENHTDNASTNDAASKSSADKRERNRWKYDVLESRVISTIHTVNIARTWLPRLLKVAESARQAEKRRAARAKNNEELAQSEGMMKTFEVFTSSIVPSIRLLVEHGAFCALGSFNGNEGNELRATYGNEAPFQKHVQAPLPATQTSKCATELAELADIVQSIAESAISLRPTESDYYNGFVKNAQYNRSESESVLEKLAVLVEDFVVTIERRKCIYAFDQCARSNSQRASGSGAFDGSAIVACVQKLGEQLTRPENCVDEIDKGCELAVHKSCEGLKSYVGDRGDSARLRAVAECANALSGSIDNVVREVSYLTNSQGSNLEEILTDDVLAVEAKMFDEFLESIRRNMTSYCKLGPMISIDNGGDGVEKAPSEMQFPPHLSASLLAIIRCRAQVEKALGEKTVRKSQSPSTYLYLAMSCAADSVVDGICYEINQRLARMRGTQADQYLNELQFLVSTLKKYLSDQVLHAVETCKNKLLAKTGGGIRNGPDGLGAIERLERLGRVFVMCLGD